ncbi:hypothetical protein Tco_0001451 [Tanacetum coccineum]
MNQDNDLKTSKVKKIKAQVIKITKHGNEIKPITTKQDQNKAEALNVKSISFNGKPLMDDKGFIDSGHSRHMTGNITYLSDFKEFDGGYVTFGRGAHGGRISGKGTLETDSHD